MDNLLTPADLKVRSMRGRCGSLHLDVNTDGPLGTPPSDRRARVDEMVERLAASGATLVTASTNEYDEYCVTMLDPEGNEFDVQ